MFFLGLACGIVLMFALAWLIASDPPEKPAPVPPSQSIHEIERQAIREMVATAMVNGQIAKSRSEAGGDSQPAADQS